MAHDVRILTEAELRAALPLDHAALDAVEDAFRALATADVVMPPVLSMALPDMNGEVDVKTAYIPGVASFAVKVSPGFFNNPKLGLPSLTGLMVLFSARTGLVEALFLDNGYLTDLRTAAAGGVAARHLAPDRVDIAGVIGTGAQARLQMQAAHLARPFAEARVWGRDERRARACADDIAARGHRHAAEVVHLERVAAPAATAQAFDLPEATPLFHSLVVHSDDRVPVLLEDRWVDAELAPGYLDQDYTATTAHDYLMSIAPPARVEHIVEAVVADNEERRLLKIGAHEPCLLMRRRTWWGDRVVSAARLLYPGTRYRLEGRFVHGRSG